MAHLAGPQPQQQTQDETMDNPTIAYVEPQSRDAKELRINLPKPFNGNRSNLNRFIQDCAVYLKIN